MNPLLSEIANIPDRSGSRQPMQETAVSAFNDFLAAQLTVPGQARLTLVQLDDAYEVPVVACYLPEVPQLTAVTYKASSQMDAQALADNAMPLDQLLREEEGKQP